MRRRGVRWVLLLAAALLLPLGLYAATAVPKLTRHVTDLTGTLTAAQVDQLDAQLLALEKAKGAQVLVLMVPTTGDQDIEGYSLAVAEANKIGRKGVDDGLLLLIAKNDHRVRYEVGYGLEGAIPDAATARITREYLAPKFRNSDYFGGRPVIRSRTGSSWRCLPRCSCAVCSGVPARGFVHRWGPWSSAGCCGCCSRSARASLVRSLARS